MKLEDIKKVLIIGAGNMGQQIGFLCAANGYETTMYDIGEDALDKAKDRMMKLSRVFIDMGRLTREEAMAAINRITFTTDPEKAAKGIDFVSESVPEDPVLKGEMFSKFNKLCPERTIFTTNTSSLIPSMFAEATGRPDRFAAFHFHNVSTTDVVDVMPHAGTLQAVTDLIIQFAKKLGQIPIVLKKESFGYVFNLMLMELTKAAQTLASNKVASFEDVDRAWMGVMKTEAGPFGIMDSIGLDTVYKVTAYWANQLNDPQALANAEFLREYVDKGHLGIKTGQGFYKYPNPRFIEPDFLTAE